MNSEPKWVYIDIEFPDENGNPISMEWPTWDDIYIAEQYGNGIFAKRRVFVSHNQGQSFERCGLITTIKFFLMHKLARFYRSRTRHNN